MLRVGLTGDLGSGKSTAARMLAARGAVVLSSDEMGRAMMQPGEPVYAAIVERFGPGVVLPDGQLDRAALARLAFAEGRVAELNAIVHPAVIARQAEAIVELKARQPGTIVVVESALIFSAVTEGEGGVWRERFDCIVLVTAPEELKIARFVGRAAAGRTLGDGERLGLEAEARRRLAAQGLGKAYEAECLVLPNSGDAAALEVEVSKLWIKLERLSAAAELASSEREL